MTWNFRDWTPALLMMLGCSEPHEAPVVDEGAPNVLLISIDTLRADHLSCYGYERATTPNLDRLAKRSIVFEDAHATSSWTLPSMVSAMTSLYPAAHGSNDTKTPLAVGPRTLAERLNEAGWLTGAVVSQVFCASRYGLDRGFHYFDDSLTEFGRANEMFSKTSAKVSDKALTWLDARAASPDSRPWFLWLHYFDPHMAYVPHAGITEDFGKREIDRYDGEIAWTDRHIGRVLDHVEELGFFDNTILCVFSDHGEEFEEHGGLYHRRTLYDEVVRVPLILHLPGEAPRKTNELASLVDLMPTILARATSEPLDGVQGIALAEHESAGREAVLAELQREDGTKLVARITRASKLIVNEGDPERFDRTVDAREQSPLPAPAAELDALTSQLELAAKLSALVSEHPEVRLSPLELEALRALGYTDEE